MHANVLLVLALEFFDIGVDWTALDGYNVNGSTGFVVDDNVRIHAKTPGSVALDRVAIDDDIKHGEITDSSGFKTYFSRVANPGNRDRGVLGDVACSGFTDPAFIISGKDIADEIEALCPGLHRRKRMYLHCMIWI